MLAAIDKVIDRITMYRLVLYYLLALIAGAIGLAAANDLHYSAADIAISAGVLVAACWVINKILAYFFDAPINSESSLITGLILALIITPSPTGHNLLFMLAASGLAMASKYVLSIGEKHIFNPAAIAVVLTALGPKQSASWWVGSAMMLPFVVVGGVLLMRKLRREPMILSFLVVTLLATAIYSLFAHTKVSTGLHDAILSSPIFFLAFVMLTEPQTSPTTKGRQMLYAALVGVLLPPEVHLGSFYSSPELSLVVGNVFAYLVSPKTKLFPVIKNQLAVATNTMDFIFRPDKRLAYAPGQYMEWTLPHTHTDSRGDRRYFTLASSPTEPDIRIGIKFYKQGSSFKQALLDIDQHTAIVASQVAGDFTLPKNKSEKLAFLAGGIGITPFRSMVKYMLDKNEQRNVTLLYGAKTEQDLAYKDVFEEARQQLGMKTIYALSDVKAAHLQSNYHFGHVSAELIKQEVPDYLERTFYISGTHQMVTSMKQILAGLGVAKRQIKTDFFPGYA